MCRVGLGVCGRGGEQEWRSRGHPERFGHCPIGAGEPLKLLCVLFFTEGFKGGSRYDQQQVPPLFSSPAPSPVKLFSV